LHHFQLVPKPWIVERTFGLPDKNRRLVIPTHHTTNDLLCYLGDFRHVLRIEGFGSKRKLHTSMPVFRFNCFLKDFRRVLKK